jgi:rsbT antagonist protein RsbS
MVVPILKQGDFLIGSVQSALTDSDITDFRNALADQVGKNRSRAVIIDVSGLDIIDSFTARTLQDITNTVKLKGAAAIVVGIQPQVAFAMVQLGLYLDGVTTALDLDEGLAMLNSMSSGWRTRGR